MTTFHLDNDDEVNSVSSNMRGAQKYFQSEIHLEDK